MQTQNLRDEITCIITSLPFFLLTDTTPTGTSNNYFNNIAECQAATWNCLICGAGRKHIFFKENMAKTGVFQFRPSVHCCLKYIISISGTLGDRSLQRVNKLVYIQDWLVFNTLQEFTDPCWCMSWLSTSLQASLWSFISSRWRCLWFILELWDISGFWFPACLRAVFSRRPADLEFVNHRWVKNGSLLGSVSSKHNCISIRK